MCRVDQVADRLQQWQPSNALLHWEVIPAAAFGNLPPFAA
jgi:hypothetical protein